MLIFLLHEGGVDSYKSYAITCPYNCLLLAKAFCLIFIAQAYSSSSSSWTQFVLYDQLCPQKSIFGPPVPPSSLRAARNSLHKTTVSCLAALALWDKCVSKVEEILTHESFRDPHPSKEPEVP